jgi:hypothetical protein
VRERGQGVVRSDGFSGGRRWFVKTDICAVRISSPCYDEAAGYIVRAELLPYI